MRAKSDSGLPSRSGFGYRASVRADADTVVEAVRANDGICTWEQLLVHIPKLKYASPVDLRSISGELKTRHAVSCIVDEHGNYIQFADMAA